VLVAGIGNDIDASDADADVVTDGASDLVLASDVIGDGEVVDDAVAVGLGGSSVAELAEASAVGVDDGLMAAVLADAGDGDAASARAAAGSSNATTVTSTVETSRRDTCRISPPNSRGHRRTTGKSAANPPSGIIHAICR